MKFEVASGDLIKTLVQNPQILFQVCRKASEEDLKSIMGCCLIAICKNTNNDSSIEEVTKKVKHTCREINYAVIQSYLESEGN